MNHLRKRVFSLLSLACMTSLALCPSLPCESRSALEAHGTTTPYFIEATYPYWRTSAYPPEYIPLDYVHQIAHVFIRPGENGTLAIPEGFLMPQLIELVHAANKKVVIGVGGAGSHDAFVAMASDPTDRATFVQNLTTFVTDQGYDGVGIDWEFPKTTTDRENLNAFMADLRAGLDATGQDLQLNIAVSPGEGFGQWIDADAITPLVNYYLLMTYGCHGAWSTESGHNTPLYPPPPEVNHPCNIDAGIHYWVETRGVPASKIVMGLTTYGISFDSEDLYQSFTSYESAPYSDIRPLINNGYTRHWDSVCLVPYLTQDSGPTIWSYDDPHSIDLKCDYVIEHNLAGVTVSNVTGDRINGQQELLEVIADRLSVHYVYLPLIQKQ